MAKRKKSKLISAGKTGIGLMAWAVSIMAIFTPWLSEYATGAALVLAAVHGLTGGVLLPGLTVVTALVNTFLLSPLQSMTITSGGIMAVLVLAALFSIKRALRSRLSGA
jgi:hypothetical protein